MKTHCKRGHPRVPENLDTKGSCKTCATAKLLLRRAENPEKCLREAQQTRARRMSKTGPVVYALVDPRVPEIFYVGYSCDPKHRLKSHSCLSDPVSKDLRARIAEMKQNNAEPAMVILEKTTSIYREDCWIVFLREQGMNLLNKRVPYAGPTRTFK